MCVLPILNHEQECHIFREEPSPPPSPKQTHELKILCLLLIALDSSPKNGWQDVPGTRQHFCSSPAKRT